MALSLQRASRLSRCSRKAASPGATSSLASAVPPVATRDRDGGGGGGGGGGGRVSSWSGLLSAAIASGGLRCLVVPVWVDFGGGMRKGAREGTA